MPTQVLNGIRIFYNKSGTNATPLVLVHGSWTSHHGWDQVVPLLADSFSVYAYDRRGHSESERPPGQGSITEDVADFRALIEHFQLGPAWVAASSFGGNIALRLAGRHPDLLRGLVLHEPPILSLLGGDADLQPQLEEENRKIQAVTEQIAAGNHMEAAKLFVENVALGPEAWENLPEKMRETVVGNAPTFLDEARDPDAVSFDPAWVEHFDKPVLLSKGTESPAMFGAIVDKLADRIPNVELRTFEGAGHVPHVTHPGRYVETVSEFVRSTEP